MDDDDNDVVVKSAGFKAEAVEDNDPANFAPVKVTFPRGGGSYAFL